MLWTEKEKLLSCLESKLITFLNGIFLKGLIFFSHYFNVNYFLSLQNLHDGCLPALSSQCHLEGGNAQRFQEAESSTTS